MLASVLQVVRDGKRWGVAVDGELMALARTKREAQNLAHEAAEILAANGGEARVEIPRETRSFKPE